MICPHCNRTIREEQKYLMSRDEHAEWPRWAIPAIWVIVFLYVFAAMALFSGSVSF